MSAPRRAGNQIAKLNAVPHALQTSVAVVMTSFDAGGTERQMIELVRRLDRDRWRVHLACIHARGPWRDRAAEAAPISEFPISGFSRPDTCRQALAFARWCARHHIAIVHTTDFYTNVFALPAATFARVPVRIGSRRGLNADRTPAQLTMQRAALKCAHAIVTNSVSVGERLRQERVDARRVTVIPNGIDVDAFRPAGARPTRRHVVTVANLRPEKGYDVLVDAAALVLERYPDARFQCVGEGPERPRIEARLAERGVAHAFVLTGPQQDVPGCLAGADIFVLPSRSESLPNSILEAMAAGLPVVATAVGGVPDLVAHERTGLLCPPGDARALADGLCRVMNDAVFGARLASAARQHAQAHYSLERMVSAFESLYERELAARGRSAEMAA